MKIYTSRIDQDDVDNNPFLLLDEHRSMFDIAKLRNIFSILRKYRETYYSVEEKDKTKAWKKVLDMIVKNKDYYDSIDMEKIRPMVTDKKGTEGVILVGQADNPLHTRLDVVGDQHNIKEFTDNKKYLQEIGKQVIEHFNLQDFGLDYDVNYVWSAKNIGIDWHVDNVITVPDRLLKSTTFTPGIILVNLDLGETSERGATEFIDGDNNYKVDHYKMALVNSGIIHRVEATPNERLTLRICLYEKTFEEIKGKIINEKTR
jgi:hypothetical protein